MKKRWLQVWFPVMALVAGAATAFAQGARPAWSHIASIDLAKPFKTRSAWRFVAVQGSPEPDPVAPENGPVPGPVRLCLTKGRGDCASGVDVTPHASFNVEALQPRMFQEAKIVYPKGPFAPPLLLARTASVNNDGDGDHGLFTQLFAYRPASDRFEPVYVHLTGSNNNQDVRYIETGPLTGSVISAEPGEYPKFRFWITVSRLSPGYIYKPVLKYRSATGYQDGNPLGVIDSDMPNIEHRLGLWRPGQPLPLPAKGCPEPRLVKMELWCGKPVPGV